MVSDLAIRPRKQILLNFFLGLSGHCHHAPAKASSSTPQIFIPPERKYENPSLKHGDPGYEVAAVWTCGKMHHIWAESGVQSKSLYMQFGHLSGSYASHAYLGFCCMPYMACNFHIALNFVLRCTGGGKSCGRFVKYNKY